MGETRQLTLQHAATTLNLLEGLGFVVNYPQVSPNTLPRNRILRIHSKFSQSKLESPKGQNKESPSKQSEAVGQPCSYSPEIGKIFWAYYTCLNSGSIPCSTTHRYLQHAKNSVLNSETTKIIRSPGQSRPRGSAGSSVVERQPSWLEWKGPSPSVYGLYHRDRCIPARMGAYCQGISTGGDGLWRKACIT